jgi:solute carrier family 35, member C2
MSVPAAQAQLEILLFSIAILSAGSSLSFFASFACDIMGSHAVRRSAVLRAASGLTLLGLCLAWWGCSSTFVLFNRFVLSGNPRFRFPIILTWSHMAMKGLVSLTIVAIAAQKRSELLPADRTRTLSCGTRAVALVRAVFALQQPTPSAWWCILVPLAVCTGLDVCFSNLSLQFAGVAIYTLTKSSSVIFTLVLSWMMRLQRISWKTAAAVVAIGAGILLANISPDPLHSSGDAVTGAWLGAAFALLASVCGAMRWVLTEWWFGRPGVENDAVALIALLSPVSVIALLPGVFWELPGAIAADIFHSATDIALVLAATLGGGVLATLMVAVELQFVSLSSAMTLTVAGVVKDLLQIALATAMFGERLSALNAAGVVLTLGGSAAYGVLRARGAASSSSELSSGAVRRGSGSAVPDSNTCVAKGSESNNADDDSKSDDLASDSELASLVKPDVGCPHAARTPSRAVAAHIEEARGP